MGRGKKSLFPSTAKSIAIVWYCMPYSDVFTELKDSYCMKQLCKVPGYKVRRIYSDVYLKKNSVTEKGRTMLSGTKVENCSESPQEKEKFQMK